MNFKDLLKKYWFVGVVGILLIVFIGAYCVDAYKNREITVKNKQDSDGRYVAYTVDGVNAYADDLYETIYTANGLAMEYTAFQRAVLNDTYETTDDIKTTASSYANYVLYYYEKDEIIADLQSMGYTNGIDDLVQYYIDAQKQELMIADYYKEHLDDIVKPYIQENDPRIIRHILIKIADVEEITDEEGNVTHVAHPTDEEQAKVDAMLEALKTGDFATVATDYSDDGSASSGGYLTVVDKTNCDNYVAEFKETAMSLKSGEVSDLITTEYGYHIVWNESSELDDLMKDSSFISLLEATDSYISIRALNEISTKLGYKVVAQDLLDEINAALAEDGGAE